LVIPLIINYFLNTIYIVLVVVFLIILITKANNSPRLTNKFNSLLVIFATFLEFHYFYFQFKKINFNFSTLQELNYDRFNK